MTPPRCPITGEPAVRLVQWVRAPFLAFLWRHFFKAPARASFGDVERIGLWESPTGLYFFDPMTEGDHEFYSRFYARLMKNGLWSETAIRREFEMAGRWIARGDRVLDVGCGFANFRRAVPHADYVGIDPHFAGKNTDGRVLDQTLSQHLSGNAGRYDAVCAFEVLEHLAAPVELFADMLRAARPGGVVMVGVPHVPSALTRIPNNLLNAPPHHLSWWTKSALVHLAERAGAIVESVEAAPWGEDDALLYWMSRCAPIRCRKVHYRNAVSWHAAALVAYFGGRFALRLFGVPETIDEGAGLLLTARRPA